MRVKYTVAIGALCAVAGCAVTPDTALMPDNVPVLYAAPEELPTEALTCEGMQLEFAYLNAGLGDYPTDRPPLDARTLSERASEKVEDLIMDALTDQIDPAIQAYRILTDAAETERKLARAKQRGHIRRAYVMGHMDAVDCARDEDTILIAAKLADGDVLEMRNVDGAAETGMALAAREDGPQIREPDIQMATAAPIEEAPIDIEVEYLIVIELELSPEVEEDTKLASAETQPPPLPADIEDEVRGLAVPNIFDTPWQEGDEPAPPPDSSTPIAGLEDAPAHS